MRFMKGDRVRWTDPDGGVCSGDGTVVSDDGEIVAVAKDDGGEVGALREELTLLRRKNGRPWEAGLDLGMEVGQHLQGSRTTDGWLVVYEDVDSQKFILFRNLGNGYLDSIDSCLVDTEQNCGWHMVQDVGSAALFKSEEKAREAIEAFAKRRGRKVEDMKAEVRKVRFEQSMRWI